MRFDRHVMAMAPDSGGKVVERVCWGVVHL